MRLTIDQLTRRVPEIIAAAIRARQPITDVLTCAPGGDPDAVAMAAPPPNADPIWQPLALGQRWGVAPGSDPALEPPRLPWQISPSGGSTHWLRAALEIPPGWIGQDVLLELIWVGQELDAVESILYLDGAAHAGLDWGHRSALLPASAHHGQHTVTIRSAVAFPRPFGGLELQLRDPQLYRLGHTMRTLLEAAQTLPPDAPARHDILRALELAYRALDLRAGYAAPQFAQSAAAALQPLEALLRQYRALPAAPGAPTVTATGHGHLDLAWLWPIRRTRQKAAHTVATALQLMDQHPKYHFSLSQPQVFAWLKQDDPALYARLRQRVLEGRLEPVGAMWVEPDCNLPSGEALIRQIAHGVRFFAQEFPERYGPDADPHHVIWLPDVFGFSAALPQIMRGCGITSFMTTKLSWNQTNRMPADTFRWRGLDGSSVLGHFLTATGAPVGHEREPVPYSYGTIMSAAELAGTWRHYRQQAMNRELLQLFGHADGGGGPAEEMLVAAETLAQIPGLPRLRLGRVDRFFQELYARVWDDERLPTWDGELYFEYHRGTYTSQARTKQANRAAELRYRQAEWLNAWALTEGGQNAQPQLDTGWELILRNQFHDILPGTSIALVYSDTQRDHAAAAERAAQAETTALQTLVPPGADLVVLNPLPWDRQEIAAIALSDGHPIPSVDAAGNPLEHQHIELWPGQPGVLLPVRAPSYGTAPLPLTQALPKVDRGPRAERACLETAELRLELDERGEIASLYDRRHERELVAAGGALNQLVIYEDRPIQWDSWDIDAFYVDKAEPLHQIETWEVVERGPLRVSVRIVRRFGQSQIAQRISLWRDSRRVDFVTEVDWQERQRLLRALFPLNIHAAHATCEVQFGALERATHRNTSWDAARFEVCAQRWVDLSEGDYGVALLNDGRYGHSFLQNTVGLTLLKGGVFPDPDADRGVHRFTYSLLPHTGDWRAAEVVRRAYELNAPLVFCPGSVDAPRSFMQVSAANVVAETVKAAHDGVGLIVRLYEAHGQRGPVTLRFARAIQRAAETDMLERAIGAVAVAGSSVTVYVRPYEVKTLRVVM